MNALVTQSLHKKKARIAIKLSKKEKEKRLEGKRRSSEKKEGRKKFNPNDF